MKRFVIEQSDDEFYTTHAGLAFIGPALNRFTSLATELAKLGAPTDLISNMDVIASYCALLAEGKSDYAAIEQHRKDDLHFRESLGIKNVPSEATLRREIRDTSHIFHPANRSFLPQRRKESLPSCFYTAFLSASRKFLAFCSKTLVFGF